MLPNFEIALEDGAGFADAFHADRIGLAANFYMPGTPSRRAARDVAFWHNAEVALYPR